MTTWLRCRLRFAQCCRRPEKEKVVRRTLMQSRRLRGVIALLVVTLLLWTVLAHPRLQLRLRGIFRQPVCAYAVLVTSEEFECPAIVFARRLRRFSTLPVLVLTTIDLKLDFDAAGADVRRVRYVSNQWWWRWQQA